MIKILKSETADTRTSDFSKVSKATLEVSSVSHIRDVYNGLRFLQAELEDRARLHDFDKIEDLNGFHSDFVGGFKSTIWWDKHRKINRHHLLQVDGVPSDVNLIDVLEMIVDCVMAGMARSGSVYPLEISPELLKQAFDNTADQLKAQVQVVDMNACQNVHRCDHCQNPTTNLSDSASGIILCDDCGGDK